MKNCEILHKKDLHFAAGLKVRWRAVRWAHTDVWWWCREVVSKRY